MLSRAACPERPERLSPLRPAASGRRALRARAGPVALLLVVAALAGCGGDDETATETTRELPDLAIPTTESEPVAPERTETTPTTVDPATETLPEEGPATTTPQAPDDTPDSDAPPPEDSPAERFEAYCNENPGACG
jgi:hypothetical protein